MLDVLLFKSGRVLKSRDSHSVVVTDAESGVAIVIVRQSGGLAEVLTPDDPEFKRILSLLAVASRVAITPPAEVRTER